MGVRTYVRVYMCLIALSLCIAQIWRVWLMSPFFHSTLGRFIRLFFLFHFFCGNIFPHLTIDIDSVGQGEHICAA